MAVDEAGEQVGTIRQPFQPASASASAHLFEVVQILRPRHRADHAIGSCRSRAILENSAARLRAHENRLPQGSFHGVSPCPLALRSLSTSAASRGSRSDLGLIDARPPSGHSSTTLRRRSCVDVIGALCQSTSAAARS